MNENDNKPKNFFHIQDFGAAAMVPQYQEVIKNKPWVFYGEDNLFPNHLLALYQYSAINRACINAITYGIKGKNLIVKNGDPNAIAMANRSETVYEVFEKCVQDQVIFGGFALNVVKSNDGDVAEFYHTDFSKIRAGKQDMFGNTGTYFYSVDWKGTQFNQQKFKPIEIPAFNMTDDTASQIMYIKSYTPGMSYYPSPDWIAGITTVQLDIEVKNFHLNNTQNSLMPSLSVSFTNGTPSEEERDMMYRQLESKYSSTNNGGKFFLFFSETPETAPIITPIPNNASDGWYANLAPQIEQTILSSHRITSPQILGIKTAGQLGGREELLDAYQLFLQTVIIPVQESMLKVFEKVIFLRDKQPINLQIEQNQLLPTDEQSAIDKTQGI
jgi:hypothetical protein